MNAVYILHNMFIFVLQLLQLMNRNFLEHFNIFNSIRLFCQEDKEIIK